ncbi:MAG: hypothetical protein QM775_13505 [Pirellulales bacterium]
MDRRDRREFLADIARGMLIAGVGYGAAYDMGLVQSWGRSARAGEADADKPLEFGVREELVCLLQETAAEKLLPLVVERINNGTELKELVACAALANARTFGGEDYVGFHTFMALAPALRMSQELSAERRALPVLKVLYRNTKRLQEQGGRKQETLKQIAADGKSASDAAARLREAVHQQNRTAADAALATAGDPDAAFNVLLETVTEGADVHRIVLASRCYDMLGIVGRDAAQTMLRQSVHYCVKNEDWTHKHHSHVAKVLPRVFDQFKLDGKLVGKESGSRTADDEWVAELGRVIFTSTPDRAADAVAGAIAEGFDPTAIAQAIALATNELILRDVGRTGKQVQAGKPEGSVHGDSIGVHACDSAHAWRTMAAAANPRNRAACLVMAGYQAANDRIERGGDFLNWQSRPTYEVLKDVAANDQESMLKQLDGAIRENDQERACAIVQGVGLLGYPARPVFDVLLKFACSEEGALHAEKFYRTTSEEFAAARTPHKWRQLVALARVTASEANQPAAGYAEACKLLGVT